MKSADSDAIDDDAAPLGVETGGHIVARIRPAGHLRRRQLSRVRPAIWCLAGNFSVVRCPAAHRPFVRRDRLRRGSDEVFARSVHKGPIFARLDRPAPPVEKPMA
jgi:hypothetical protein